MKIVLIATILSFVSLFSCENSAIPTPDLSEISIAKFSIDEPLKNAKELAEIFLIDPTCDTILITNNGSFLKIPSHAFEDKDGKIIRDSVAVHFEEFNNPADIILSGIPMQFVENKDTMNFQSAGMCSVLVTCQKNPVEIVAGKELTIGMRSLQPNPDFNLYFFDTLKGQWQELEKNLAVEEAKPPLKPVNIEELEATQILHIEIENHWNRPIYKMWHKTKYKIHKPLKEKELPKNIWWYDLSFNETKHPDLFEVIFQGALDGNQYSVKYIVQPTFEGENFELAKEDFRVKMREYTIELLKVKEQLAKDLKEDEKMKAEMEDFRKEQLANEKDKWRLDSLAFVKFCYTDSLRFAKENEINEAREDVMRTFSVNRFGIFNCDRFYKSVRKNYSINTKWNSKPLDLDKVYLVNTLENAVIALQGTYNSRLDLSIDNRNYTLVGIFLDEIFTAQIHPGMAFNTTIDLEMNKISLDDFRELMNRNN